MGNVVGYDSKFVGSSESRGATLRLGVPSFYRACHLPQVTSVIAPDIISSTKFATLGSGNGLRDTNFCTMPGAYEFRGDRVQRSDSVGEFDNAGYQITVQ